MLTESECSRESENVIDQSRQTKAHWNETRGTISKSCRATKSEVSRKGRRCDRFKQSGVITVEQANSANGRRATKLHEDSVNEPATRNVNEAGLLPANNARIARNGIQRKKEGAGTIPAKKLFELMRLLPEGEIKFKLLENHWVQISTVCVRPQTTRMISD